jgi:hypothetical protein
MKKLISYINFFTAAVTVLIGVVAVGCVPANTSNKVEVESQRSYSGSVIPPSVDYELINQDGQVVDPLLKLLRLFNIKHTGTIESINQAMQESFIRKPGSERWDLKDAELDKEVRNEALALFQEMGFMKEIPHSQISTDYFLLFGAALPRMEKRFKDFLEQYTAGNLQCSYIAWLGSIRKLQPNELETMKSTLGTHFEDFLKDEKVNKAETDLTEADVTRYLWNTYATAELKSKFQEPQNLVFINSTDTTQGANNRPTTGPTIDTWLTEFKPAPGRCHGNVEKPYGIRMEKNLRLCLEKYSAQLSDTTEKFSITWNSPAANPELLLSIYKDELARSFYQEYTLKKHLGVIQPENRLS